MHLFWEHGYEGTSMAVLTAELGVNKPSIYGAFGSKEELFRKVLSRYLEHVSQFVVASLQQPRAYGVAEKLLVGAAHFLPDASHPPGCMLTQCALTSSQEGEHVRNELINYRNALKDMLEKRFAQAKAEHDLPESANPRALATLVATLHQGMSVQAAGGASSAELMQAVELVLKNWPR